MKDFLKGLVDRWKEVLVGVLVGSGGTDPIDNYGQLAVALLKLIGVSL